MTLPDGATITFDGVRRWASLQVARNPGTGPALAAAVLALAGLMLSLFVRRRRVWVRVASRRRRAYSRRGRRARAQRGGEPRGLTEEVGSLAERIGARGRGHVTSDALAAAEQQPALLRDGRLRDRHVLLRGRAGVLGPAAPDGGAPPSRLRTPSAEPASWSASAGVPSRRRTPRRRRPWTTGRSASARAARLGRVAVSLTVLAFALHLGVGRGPRRLGRAGAVGQHVRVLGDRGAGRHRGVPACC